MVTISDDEYTRLVLATEMVDQYRAFQTIVREIIASEEVPQTIRGRFESNAMRTAIARWLKENAA